MSDSPRTLSEHVQSGREALDKLVEGLDTVRTEHARAYREVCDSLAALVALADRNERRDDWLAKQLDGCIDDAQIVCDMRPFALSRALVSNLKDARAVLAGGAGDE